jgi:hypothetical protein
MKPAVYMYGGDEKYVQNYDWEARRKETTWKTLNYTE